MSLALTNLATGDVAALDLGAESDIVLGRGEHGLPDIPKVHRQHARVGWREGKAVVKNLGKNKLNVVKAGTGTCVQLIKDRDWTALGDGDKLCLSGYDKEESSGFVFSVVVALAGTGGAGAPSDVASAVAGAAPAAAAAVAMPKPRSNDKGSLITHAQWARVGPLTGALEAGQDPDFQDQNGCTPLHIVCQGVQKISEAAQLRKAECVTLLLEFGASPDRVDAVGFTALQYAVQGSDQPAVVKALLVGGCNAAVTVPGPDGVIDVKMLAQMQGWTQSVEAITAHEAQCAEDAIALAQQLDRAFHKFEEMDADGNGTLDSAELIELARWMFESFHPGGVPLTDAEQNLNVARLINNLDGKCARNPHHSMISRDASERDRL